jgi:hypothetical protein
MEQKKLKALLQAVEKLANSRIDDLRMTAATGIDARYSPTDAKLELAGFYYDKGKLIRFILERDYIDDELDPQ